MVEVKELVLRANFTERPNAAANGQGMNANGDCGDASGAVGADSNGSGTNTDVVEDCVRQVLAILKRQKER